MPLLARPAPCRGCPLDDKAQGFAPADGPPGAWLLLVGEALGYVEALTGRPFVGDAGGMLTRLLNLLGWSRDSLRIHNVISCFPGDTLVDAAGIQRGYRRWYGGELVTVETREGILSGTPNHPVLTAHGWVALGELRCGDDLVRGFVEQGMTRRHPDVEDRPSTFAEAFDALARTGIARRVVGRAMDFHGDGLDGDVDVVAANRVLSVRALHTILQQREQLALDAASGPAETLVGDRPPFLTTADLYGRGPLPPRRLVGGRYEGRTSLRVEASPTRTLGVGVMADYQAGIAEGVAQARLPHAVLDRERLQTFPIPVALAEVIKIQRSAYTGHVYNLQTLSKQYVVNGFIAHNCHPPGDWFDERAPWYHGALAHCRYLDHTLAEGPQVVVPMGATALKKVLGLTHHKKVRVQDFHGAIVRDPTDRFWVVPTYHPGFLQRGATNLIGTVLWDLQRAVEARDHGRPVDPGSLVVDPPIEWFRAWVDQVVAARQQDRGAYPISSDIETPDKAGGRDEGEITTEDKSFQLLRHNVACHVDEGVTVPHAEPYLRELARLYGSPGAIWMWNREYDFVRQVHAALLTEADSPRVVDLMWLWHVLQSDVPRGLGYVAPFYSTWGPWKHLAESEPGRYGAIDGLQTHRVGFGVLGDLIQTGQLPYAMRHVHELHTKVLRPAQLVGVQINRPRLLAFKQQLADKAREKLATIQTCVPEALAPLTPKGGLTRPPAADLLHVRATAFTRKGTPRAGKPTPEIKQELYARARVLEKLVLKEVLVCQTCGAIDVQRRHRCPARPPAADGLQQVPHSADRAGRPVPQLDLAPASVRRWYWQEPFNPDSVPQVLAYIKYRKHKPGRSKKTKAEESTDRATLSRLSRTTGDPFYAAVLDYRAINKVKGTYVEGTERRLDSEDRLHPVPTFKPSTMRLSYVNPNITNVVADKGGESLASGFRSCVVASPGCRLLEVDFSAIEAVETGWCARDPKLMRLARLGIHSYLIAARLDDAPDLAAPDVDIIRHLQEVKKHAGALLYDQIKHTVYGVFYGQTPIGLQYTWPHLYPTQKAAEELIEFMFSHLPSVKTYQHVVCDTAARQHYLGGHGAYVFQSPGPSAHGHVSGHPFSYKHWFWSVYAYRRLTTAQYYRLVAKARRAGVEPPVVEITGQHFRVAHGPDANRAIAFYPQSIARGVLTEALARLLYDPDAPSYIGDAYFGRTPLRAPIHDSGLFDVPLRAWDQVVERVTLEMQRPILEQPLLPEWGMGTHLQIGVAAKGGPDWQAVEDVIVNPFNAEWAPAPMELEDEEDWESLQRAV